MGPFCFLGVALEASERDCELPLAREIKVSSWWKAVALAMDSWATGANSILCLNEEARRLVRTEFSCLPTRAFKRRSRLLRTVVAREVVVWSIKSAMRPEA